MFKKVKAMFGLTACQKQDAVGAELANAIQKNEKAGADLIRTLLSDKDAKMGGNVRTLIGKMQ